MSFYLQQKNLAISKKMGINTSKLTPTYRGTSYKDLAEHFFGTCVSSKQGKLLLTLWTLQIVISIGAGIKQRREKARSKAQHKESSTKMEGSSSSKHPPTLITQLKTILPLAFPSVWNKSCLYLLCYTLALIVRIWLTIKVPILHI